MVHKKSKCSNFKKDNPMKQLDTSRQFKPMHGDKIGNLSTSLKIRFPNASTLCNEWIIQHISNKVKLTKYISIE